MQRRLRYLCLALAIGFCNAPASAGPPSYLLLRSVEGPTRQTGPNGPPIRREQVYANGYAYGWFGTQPRVHGSRHFGYQRLYTEWSFK